MDKKMIRKIQERMCEVGAPGACVCCPIALYGHLSPKKLKVPGFVRYKDWIWLLKRKWCVY